MKPIKYLNATFFLLLVIFYFPSCSSTHERENEILLLELKKLREENKRLQEALEKQENSQPSNDEDVLPGIKKVNAQAKRKVQKIILPPKKIIKKPQSKPIIRFNM